MKILRVALLVPVDRAFDYLEPESLDVKVGDRVVVPFGTRQCVGIAVATSSRSEVDPSRLKPVTRVLGEAPPLSREWLALMQFVARYYLRPFGESAVGALPPRLRSLRPLPRAVRSAPLAAPCGTRFESNHVPTPAQARAIEQIAGALGTFRAFLLHGVTGSGKTEVYLRLIARVLERGAQALVLVPEISLTPQFEARVRSAFPDARLAVLHSALEDVARTSAWLAAARGDAQIVLGTRLAVLAPLPALALIVVDEEHDSSFKQQEGLRYSGRDIAVARAKLVGCPVVLGTATPSLESWHNCLCGRYRLLELPERAVPGARLPAVRTIDLRSEVVKQGFSPPVISAIRERLARGEQSLVFINRRGYAPVLACEACGWAAACTRCTARLVLHAADRRLRCHHCGGEAAIPRFCPTCGNADLKPLGRGTQRIEEALGALFPEARIVRIDRDSVRRRAAFSRTLESVRRGEADILVGTQLLAKGHDFPRLTLVAVLNADSALLSTDYRAAERLFATLAQVSGRAGRRDEPGEVQVQTRYPDHPLFAALTRHDFAGFAASQLAEREAGGFPPSVFEVALRAEARSVATALAFLRRVRTLVPVPAPVRVYDPVPHVITRRAGWERAQLLLQSASRPALQRYARALREALQLHPPALTRWYFDVDPIEFA